MNQLFSLSVEAWKAAPEECIDICWYTDYNAHDQPVSQGLTRKLRILNILYNMSKNYYSKNYLKLFSVASQGHSSVTQSRQISFPRTNENTNYNVLLV